MIKQWLGVYRDNYGRKISGDTQSAYMDALRGYNTEDLDKAMRKAFEECKFMPTPSEIIERLVVTGRANKIKWIPPVGGECIAAQINGKDLEGFKRSDGISQQRCACRTCRPNVWCQWKYSDGNFCNRLSKDYPYCWVHLPSACEHFDILELSNTEQREWLERLRAADELVFQSEDKNPTVPPMELPLAGNRKEFLAQLHEVAKLKIMPGKILS